MPRVVLEDLNLKHAEKVLVEAELAEAGSIVEAAPLLGVTRHQVKRLILRHSIEWPRGYTARKPPETGAREAAEAINTGKLAVGAPVVATLPAPECCPICGSNMLEDGYCRSCEDMAREPEGELDL